MEKVEAPEFSIGSTPDGKPSVRVDSGKFMDSCFNYVDIKHQPNGVLTFGTEFITVIVNGVQRDEMQLRHQHPELIDEFANQVAGAIMEELVQIAKAEVDPAKGSVG